MDLVGGWTTHGPGQGFFVSEVEAASAGARVFAAGSEAAHDSAIYRSDDGGSTWQRISDSPGPDFIDVLAVDPRDPDRLFVTTIHAGFSGFTTRLFRSVDGGVSWSLRQSQFGFASTAEIVFDPTDPRIVYVAWHSLASVQRSIDGGETFTDFPAPFSADVLAAAPDGSLVAGSDRSIFVSHDRAQSWSAAAPAPFQCPVRSLAIDANDSRRWFVGTGRNEYPCGEVFRTEDGGGTWTLVEDLAGPVDDIALDAFHAGVLYAAIGPADSTVFVGRVLASSDGGETWIDLRLPITPGAYALSLGERGSRLHAATAAGVWERSFRWPTSLSPRGRQP